MLKKLQNLFLSFNLHQCDFSTSYCSTIVCLRILNTYIYIFEHNLYIGDVKVSPKDRCLKLSQ